MTEVAIAPPPTPDASPPPPTTPEVAKAETTPTDTSIAETTKAIEAMEPPKVRDALTAIAKSKFTSLLQRNKNPQPPLRHSGQETSSARVVNRADLTPTPDKTTSDKSTTLPEETEDVGKAPEVTSKEEAKTDTSTTKTPETNPPSTTTPQAESESDKAPPLMTDKFDSTEIGNLAKVFRFGENGKAYRRQERVALKAKAEELGKSVRKLTPEERSAVQKVLVERVLSAEIQKNIDIGLNPEQQDSVKKAIEEFKSRTKKDPTTEQGLQITQKVLLDKYKSFVNNKELMKRYESMSKKTLAGIILLILASVGINLAKSVVPSLGEKN